MNPARTNGDPVTRAELGAHLERIDARLESMDAKLNAIQESVRRPQRWIGQRVTVLLDRGLIIVVTALIAYIVTNG